MKHLIVLTFAAFFISGCAGLVAPFVNNPYAGTYSGTFTDSDGRAGPASITLTNIGNVFGNLTNTAANQQGSISGSVNTHLDFSGTIAFPSFNQSVSGTFTSTAGEVTGTLTSTAGYSITIDVSSTKSGAKRTGAG